MADDSGHSDSMVDLTKFVRKATTSPILSVSSSDQNNDRSSQVLVSSEETVQPDHIHTDSEKVAESADDDSGNLKRKLEQSENIESTYNNKIQETDSAMDSPMNTTSCSTTTTITDDIKDQVASSAPIENDEPPQSYDCSLCSRSFTSHQALGGHKASHNKFKMTICDVIDVVRTKKQLLITNTCDQRIASSTAGQSNIIAVGGDDRTHTCKICFHKFPSGQALGGHQRRHWTGNSTPADPKKTPKILDFDLNQLPKEEDHEDPSAN